MPGAAPLASSGATGIAVAAERRLVTVVFADLVGFTTLAEDQDPEDTREFLTRYFDLTRAVVERHGGTVEKFIGDAVMAVWGAPTAHEDDAERAVRAALDIVRGVPALGDRFPVEVRAGVLTGEAAVTVGATGQGLVAGDIVNTASRLQSVAPAGSVLVGEATYRAATGAIAFEQAGKQLLKGKEAPVPAWRAVSVVALRRGSGRRDALEPPFIGRDDELRLLKDLFHATDREQKARLVSIVGQAGIGKSRLAWEFEKYIDGVVDTVWWHSGRSPSYGEGISYWALAEMVRGRAGIAETDTPDAARDQLHRAMSEWITDDAERRWVEPRLAALLALEQMPQGLRDELFAAWRTFFGRIAERGPTVLLFEDIQWADEGMLDFIEELLDASRNLPLFVITLARPELFERRPGWGSSLRSLTSMRLEALNRSHIGQIVRGTVPGISDQAVDAIVARAEGIPLYAVETIRMLIDRGELTPVSEGRYEMAGSIARLAVPETLHALVAARLDGLSEREKRLLQAAAVVGQSFTAQALAAVTSEAADALREGLQVLVRRQLLRVETDPRSPERGQYAFVQSVVKEVAEGSLSRADRRALHLAAARYYESLGDDELAGVLASHYIEAYRSAPAGPEADAIAAQARVTLRAAAERASALHSHAQALSYLTQALAVTTDAAEQALIYERAAHAAEQASRLDDARAHGARAQALYEESGDRLGALRAVTLQASAHLDEHGERPAIALLSTALERTKDLPPSPEVGRAQSQLARAQMMAGRSPEAIGTANQALAVLSSDDEVIDLLVTKGTALLGTAAAREGEALLRGAIEIADNNGLIWTGLRARNNVLGIIEDQHLEQAETLLRESFAIAEKYGFVGWSDQISHVALATAFDRADWEAWLPETAELGLTPFYRTWRDSEVATRQAFRGQIDEARAVLARAATELSDISSQAAGAISASKVTLAVAAADWSDVMANARAGWSHPDSTVLAVQWTVVAGVGAAKPEWVQEAAHQIEGPKWRGGLKEAVRAFALAGIPLAAGQPHQALAGYRSARRALEGRGARLLVALLDLCAGAVGGDQVPEFADAGRAAAKVFTSLDAGSFVARFRGAVATSHSQSRPGSPEGAITASAKVPTA